jgi:putative flippase GtrA
MPEDVAQDDVAEDVASSAPAAAGQAAPARKAARHWRAALRFTRYSALSLVTVPVGYTLLLVARHFWHVNAGLLNLAVGTVLTPPSFLLYRWLVWSKGSGRGMAAEMFSFWQTVVAGALASSVLIALVDAWIPANGPLIVLAGLTGQGVVFIARFFWLDKVTFAASASETGSPMQQGRTRRREPPRQA